MKRRYLPKRVGCLIVSMFLTTASILPISYLTIPYIQKWRHTRRLTSPDLEQREKALNFVVRKADESSFVRWLAIRRLGIEDRGNFLQIVMALDRAGQWRHPPIPLEPWLRWLDMLAEDPDPATRIVAAQQLASMTDQFSHEPVRRLIEKLIGDDNRDVRYNAMVATAQAAAQTGPAARPFLISQLHRLRDDREPAIARRAWLLLHLLQAAPPLPADWKSLPPQVAQVAVWATASTETSPTAADIATDPAADPIVRAMAAYSLYRLPPDVARPALLRILAATPPQAVTAENQHLIWRAVLAMPMSAASDNKDDPTVPLRNWAQTTPSVSTDRRDLLIPLLLAVSHQVGTPVPLPPPPTTTQPDEASYLNLLAALESPRSQVPPVSLTAQTPDLIRLAAVAAAQTPNPDDLYPLLGHEQPTMRDLACVVAADRFSKEQNESLIPRLLRDYNDHAKMSGAILAGLTGLQQPLLAKRMADEDIWIVQQIMKLGLWMQRYPLREPMHELAPALLIRDDVPKTTVLLALLHRQPDDALDYLLNPRGEPLTDLVTLLDEYRWWPVLRRYLPADAPPFWPWADPDLERFQIDVLRDWRLLEAAKPAYTR